MKKPRETCSPLGIDEFEVETKRPRYLAPQLQDDHMEIEAKPMCHKGMQPADTTGKPDKILKEMVAAGNYRQDEIVQFCLDSGIPLSRMFELDLMRLNRHGCVNR